MECALTHSGIDQAGALPPSADLIVVGSGPAGIAAAVEATRRGLRVIVLDENPASGGRVWQALEARGADNEEEDAGLALIRELVTGDAEIHHDAQVWSVETVGSGPVAGEAGGIVHWTEDGSARIRRGRRILLATGTTERPMPLPGWTLPGVMTIGAAQIALKTASLVPDSNTWLAGQGPLLWLYAVQALRAGGKLGGILDLSAPGGRWRALPRTAGAIADMRKGLAWIAELDAAGVQRLRATDLHAEANSTGAVSRITFKVKGKARTEICDLLLLHDGVIPSIQITRALGCAHAWHERQRYWKPVTDPWGETSVSGILVAGDGAGIGGATAAVASGRIAALGAAHALGHIDAATRDREAETARAERRRAMASRGFLDALHAPLPPAYEDATVVCRCEEITAGQIRDAARSGCQGLNQLKAYTRCGMGPCQGRMCATTAAEVLARERGVPAREIEPLQTRFPARPLTVGTLAGLKD